MRPVLAIERCKIERLFQGRDDGGFGSAHAPGMNWASTTRHGARRSGVCEFGEVPGFGGLLNGEDERSEDLQRLMGPQRNCTRVG